jgi:hypothetical protein
MLVDLDEVRALEWEPRLPAEHWPVAPPLISCTTTVTERDRALGPVPATSPRTFRQHAQVKAVAGFNDQQRDPAKAAVASSVQRDLAKVAAALNDLQRDPVKVAAEFSVPRDLVRMVAEFNVLLGQERMVAAFVLIDPCVRIIDQADQVKAAAASDGRAMIGGNGPRIIVPTESPTVTATAGTIGAKTIAMTFGATGTIIGTITITGSTTIGGTTITGTIRTIPISITGDGRRGR